MSLISPLPMRLLARVASVGLIGASVLGWCWTRSATAAVAAPASHASVPARDSLRFDRNEGQWDPEVRFALRGNGYGLYLTPSAATLALRRSDEAQQSLTMKLVGAKAVEPRGERALPGVTNHFVGAQRDRWRSDVTSFARVRYPGVLAGVDIVYYGSRARELEYDLELAPGAKADSLVVELDGALAVRLDEVGDALLELPDGSFVRKHRPIAYQVDDSGARRAVPAQFRVLGATQLGFTVGHYDQTRALIIDPTITYSTYLGGSRFDEFFAIGADAAGNTYAVGYTTGTLFPTHAPAQGPYGGGASDAVVCKLRADGLGFVYATYLGGADADRAYSVAVDVAGSAYVAGVTFSSNFPTAAALQPVHGGAQDAFVSKLSATGALIYSTYLGGSADDVAQGVAVRATGEAYVTGTTFSGNFPLAAALQTSLQGTSDGFVARLSTAGNSLTYATYLGGSANDLGQALTVDSSGAAYVVGQTGSPNFPTLTPVQAANGGGVSDAFVTKLAPSGSALVYSTYLGGTLPDVETAVAQVGGAAIVAGYTSSFNFPTQGSDQPTLGGSSDAFVSRINTSGNVLDFSTYLGGSGADAAASLVVDQNNYVYVGGQTASTNFPLQAPLSGQGARQGSSDGFVAAFANGGSRVWSTYLGGGSTDAIVGLALGGPTNLHVLGNTLSTNFPIVGVPLFGSALGPQDGFVARMTTLSLSPAPASRPHSAALLALLLLGAALGAASFRGPARRIAP